MPINTYKVTEGYEMKIEDFKFTKRESIIIDLAAKGYENKEIAQNLKIKVHQVRYSVNNVKVKISFHSKFATTERMFTIFCHEYMKKLKEEQDED